MKIANGVRTKNFPFFEEGVPGIPGGVVGKGDNLRPPPLPPLFLLPRHASGVPPLLQRRGSWLCPVFVGLRSTLLTSPFQG